MLPNTYIIIWADDDTEEGNLHTNFNLDASGDEIGIFPDLNIIIQLLIQFHSEIRLPIFPQEDCQMAVAIL